LQPRALSQFKSFARRRRKRSQFLDISIGHNRCSPWLQVLNQAKEETTMLWTIFVILLVLWLVGLVSSYTMGGFIHLLLVLALVVLVLNLITGRRAV
jgi:predicted nucleic acid-binding Zn ribbon protein